MEGVMYPAVLGRPVLRGSIISIRRFGWRHCGFSIIFLVFVEIAVLHAVWSVRTGYSREVLTAALILLDGLVKRPELTEKRHVLLPQAHHLFPEQSQGGIQVRGFVGQQIVRVVPASAQVVLDHGLLHVHPLHVPPRAAAGVQQPAQALGQRRQTLDTGQHTARRSVPHLTIHSNIHKQRALLTDDRGMCCFSQRLQQSDVEKAM